MRRNFDGHKKLFICFKMYDHEELFKLTRMSLQQFDYLHFRKFFAIQLFS